MKKQIFQLLKYYVSIQETNGPCELQSKKDSFNSKISFAQGRREHLTVNNTVNQSLVTTLTKKLYLCFVTSNKKCPNFQSTEGLPLFIIMGDVK